MPPDLPRDQVLRHMVNALTEPSPTVRADAARSLAEMQGDDCALLLRLKARAGDAEPVVAGQILESLLALKRRAALPFVRQFLAASPTPSTSFSNPGPPPEASNTARHSSAPSASRAPKTPSHS